MPITVVCSNCSARFSAPDKAAGKSARCAKCGSKIVVPELAPEIQVAPPEPSLDDPDQRVFLERAAHKVTEQTPILTRKALGSIGQALKGGLRRLNTPVGSEADAVNLPRSHQIITTSPDPYSRPGKAGEGVRDYTGYPTEVIGESQYQQALNHICGGKSPEGHRFEVPARLIWRDQGNISVNIEGSIVGYLDDADSKAYRSFCKFHGLAGEHQVLPAIITGGWKVNHANQGFYGVRLALQIPRDFYDAPAYPQVQTPRVVEYHPPPNPPANNTLLACAGGCGCLFLLGMLLLVGSCISVAVTSSQNSRSKTPSVNTQSNSTRIPRRGETVMLGFEGTGLLVLAVDKEALSEYLSLSNRMNSEGVHQLVKLGRLHAIPNHSRAVVVDAGLLSSRVRVISTNGYGKEGLISTEFIRPIAVDKGDKP